MDTRMTRTTRPRVFKMLELIPASGGRPVICKFSGVLRSVPSLMDAKDGADGEFGCITASSGVTEKSFEAVVHVVLDVAVKESQPRLIGDKVYGGAAKVRHDYRVFDQTMGPFPVDLYELRLMAMQMHRVGIIGAIAIDETVALTLLQHELALVRIRLAV